MLISVQTCLVDRINNVFPSRSLYGVSLWRNKVLTGSVPFAFRETRFRRLYIFLLLVACRLILFSFPYLLEYVCEHNGHKLCSGFPDLFICG